MTWDEFKGEVDKFLSQNDLSDEIEIGFIDATGSQTVNLLEIWVDSDGELNIS